MRWDEMRLDWIFVSKQTRWDDENVIYLHLHWLWKAQRTKVSLAVYWFQTVPFVLPQTCRVNGMYCFPNLLRTRHSTVDNYWENINAWYVSRAFVCIANHTLNKLILAVKSSVESSWTAENTAFSTSTVNFYANEQFRKSYFKKIHNKHFNLQLIDSLLVWLAIFFGTVHRYSAIVLIYLACFRHDSNDLCPV